jgi:hypothetical protein
MSHSRPVLPLGTAIALAFATIILAAGVVHAQNGCDITVTPGSVPVGGQFTVAGNFGNAQIFLVRGANASGPAENAQPNATTPAGSSFSVTFTAEASDVGAWTVWGLLPASECGDSAQLTVTAAPNTAVHQPPTPLPTIGFLLLVLALALVAYRLVSAARRVSP